MRRAGGGGGTGRGGGEGGVQTAEGTGWAHEDNKGRGKMKYHGGRLRGACGAEGGRSTGRQTHE
jgi:hypothetical protein